MKNKILIFFGGLVLLAFLIFGTYAWYLYFLRASGSFNISNTNRKENSSGIIFQDDGNSVYDSNAKTHDETDVQNVPTYNFKVTNIRDTEGSYNLYIEDLPINAIDDGCTTETLLDRSQLKYQLTLDGKVIKDDYMSNIKDNIIDSRKIDANKINIYTLKVYIHEDAEDWVGKHYHYKVTINK